MRRGERTTDAGVVEREGGAGDPPFTCRPGLEGREADPALGGDCGNLMGNGSHGTNDLGPYTVPFRDPFFSISSQILRNVVHIFKTQLWNHLS